MPEISSCRGGNSLRSASMAGQRSMAPSLRTSRFQNGEGRRKPSMLLVIALTSLVFIAVVCLAGETTALPLVISVPSNARKCFVQEVLDHSLLMVVANPVTQRSASVTADPPKFPPQFSLLVTHNASVIFTDNYVEGKSLSTAFTTVSRGEYHICILNYGKSESDVKLKVAHGTAANDYSKVARKDHLDGPVVALRMLEDKLREYHRNLLQLRNREHRLRSLNEATAQQLVLVCVINVVVLVVVSGLYVIFFRSFFHSKKII